MDRESPPGSTAGGFADDPRLPRRLRRRRSPGEWLASVHVREQGPALIRAGRAALDWMNRPGTEPLSPDGMFLAACLWREKGFGRGDQPALLDGPASSAFTRLVLRVGIEWMAGFMACVTAAARVAGDELGPGCGPPRQRAGRRPVTARSRLPDAHGQRAARANRHRAGPCQEILGVTPQAALGLLQQLIEAQELRRFPHVGGIREGHPGAEFRQAPPQPREPQGQVNGRIGGCDIKAGSLCGGRRQLAFEAARPSCGAVGASQTGVAQRQVLGMDPDVGMGEPASRFAIGHPCPQPLSHGWRGSFHACLKSGNGILCTSQGRQERVGVIRPDCELARAKGAGRIDFIVGFP